MLLHRRRADELMRREGLDALVASSPANVTYLSDYYCSLDAVTRESMMTPGGSSDRVLLVFAILPADGPPALVLPSVFVPNADGSWIRDLYPYGEPVLEETNRHAPTAAQALARALADRGLAGARIGLEQEDLPQRVAAALHEQLPRSRFEDCTNLLRVVRAVKSDEEIARLRRSAEIAEEAARDALADARPGVGTQSIAASFRRGVAERDADVDHFAFGLRGRGIAMQPSYSLRADDVMYVDYGCVRGRCFSDAGLTLALDEPAARLLAGYDVLRTCVAAGAEELVDGRNASSVWEAMHAVAGADAVTSMQGHGLGLEVREHPLIVPGADMALESGMVVNLEASIFEPGLASLHVERSFVVGKAGGSELVAQRRDTPFIPANER